MPIDLIQGFNVGLGQPLDAKSVKPDASSRYAINPIVAYEGLVVYQEDNNNLYKLIDTTQVGNSAGWELVGSTFPYTGDAQITGSLSVSGSINHDLNQFNTIYTSVGSSTNGIILTFDPTLYYSCFIEYHVFLYDGTIQTSRAGNIKISVPYNYTDCTNYNIPFVENTTEYGIDLSKTNKIEDVYFKVTYDNSLIKVYMYNDDGLASAYINAEYRLVGFKM